MNSLFMLYMLISVHTFRTIGQLTSFQLFRLLTRTYAESNNGEIVTSKKLLGWTKKLICEKYQLLAWFCNDVLLEGIYN